MNRYAVSVVVHRKEISKINIKNILQIVEADSKEDAISKVHLEVMLSDLDYLTTIDPIAEMV